MFIIHNTDSKFGPIQKLKAAQDTPIEQFSVLACVQEIEDLTAYVKEITYDPAIIRGQIQKIMLLHIAALRFIILAFENEDEVGYDLIEVVKRCQKPFICSIKT